MDAKDKKIADLQELIKAKEYIIALMQKKVERLELTAPETHSSKNTGQRVIQLYPNGLTSKTN